jgi:hypothetical protein
LEVAEAEAETPVVMEVERQVVAKAGGWAPVVEKGKAVAGSGMEAKVTAVVDSEAVMGLLCLWNGKHTSNRMQ